MTKCCKIVLRTAILLLFGGAFFSRCANIMTPDGGPGYSTAMMVNYIHELAFRNGRMGRGAAASIILFLVIFGLTTLRNKIGGSKEIDT